MNIIKPSFEILTDISEGGLKELKHIERVGRVCYKSENKITDDGESAKKLIANLIKNGHESVLEHSQLSVLFVTDRAVSHELVRHRLCSFAQESQRYCNYSKDKFDSEVTFITPWWISYFLTPKVSMQDGIIIRTFAPNTPDYIDNQEDVTKWFSSCLNAEKTYFDLLNRGAAPQDARAVLPNSTKTEIVMTTNYREWRHILKLRTSDAAHPDMRGLMRPLLAALKNKIPVVFDDISEFGLGDIK